MSIDVVHKNNMFPLKQKILYQGYSGGTKQILFCFGMLYFICSPAVACVDLTDVFGTAKSLIPSTSPTHRTFPENSSFSSLILTSFQSHSSAPTPQPSFLRSDPYSEPTFFPSPDVPTELPSNNPSASPSNQPFQPPSSQPSSSPTLECHDHTSYRSPINDLTCEDHRGTNCASWRVLGLNTRELADLVNQCPHSCQVPCGDFLQFSMLIGITIKKVPGLMDTEATFALETATHQHLENYARKELRDGEPFEIDSVELVSQKLFSDHFKTEDQGRRAKEVNDLPSTSLSVGLLTNGFAIGVPNERLSKLFLEGIDDESFNVALLTSDGFFSESEVTSFGSWSSGPELQPQVKKRKMCSSREIALSMTFAALFSVSVIWYWTYHVRSTKWRKFCCARSGIDTSFIVNSPLRYNNDGTFSITATSAIAVETIDNSPSLMSFDDSRASTHRAGNGSTAMRVHPILSMIRSRSSSHDVEVAGPPFTGSTFSPEEQQRTTLSLEVCEDGTFAMRESKSAHLRLEDDKEGTSATEDNYSHDEKRMQHREEVLIEHPLSHIIPPMIVIDIEENRKLHFSRDASKLPQQVPGRTLHASKDLLAALRRGEKYKFPEAVIFSEHSLEERNRERVSFHWQGRDLVRRFPPIGLIMDDSDMDSKESAASSPEQSQGTHPSPLQHRRVASLGAATQPKSDSGLLRSSLFYSTRKPEDNIGYLLNHQKDHTRGRDLTVRALSMPGKTTNGRTTNVLRRTVSSETMPERPKANNFVRGGRSLSFGSIGTEVSDRDSTGAYGCMVAATTMKSLKTQPSKSEPLRDGKTDGVVGPVKVVVEASEGRDDDTHTFNMTRLGFEAPRNGQLGLILEAETFPKEGSITFSSVKDYSPLLGLVQPGDKIVEDTTSCNLEDMTRLLTGTKPSLIIPSESYQPPHQLAHNLNFSILRSHSDNDSPPDLIG